MSTALYKLIDEGEHQQQDFKFCINDSKKIAKSLVAFANTDGGRLLIGVKDNGKVAGISTDEEFYMIEAAAKIYSNPPVDFSTKQWHVDGKTVLEIDVHPSEQKPHLAKDESGKWLAYVRIKDENVLAHKIQLLVWRKESSPTGIHFSFSENERFLVNYLQHNKSISFSKFIRVAHTSRKEAEEILSNFVLMGVLRMHTTKERTLFSLDNEFDTEQFSGFK
ncbi:Putative DNA-binding domain-containing protein [Mariniphaga anaerophila]|uniref:Putative DNA-binding domain-containing protein n=1 Tax=Mariniphaga anaerophila TaxID=1484053 RepID=A0A1M5E0F2_9BACT|nr:ATP-binding protein [Mariniphaga anaerophila]SHF72748.1 Putative DNA-binding domain-containing protein [Mariniphaga anaerophila]